jgi:DNA-binding Lrp family transcriptional regulator
MLKNIKVIPEVQEAHIIYGAYDIIAKLKTETMQYLKYTIDSSIRGLDNIRSVITLTCMDEKES